MEDDQTIICVGGRCYRKSAVTRRPVAGGPAAGASGTGAGAGAGAGAGHGRSRYTEASGAVGVTEDDPSIARREDGSFEAVLRVAPDFYRHIVGRGGTAKQQLERDTGTKVNVPTKREQRVPAKQIITIKGPTLAGVSEAKTRVELTIDRAMERMPYTHFLSIPMGACAPAFRTFKTSMLEKHATELEDSLFNKPEQLHMTLLMLKLPNPDQFDSAVEVLRKAEAEIKALVKAAGADGKSVTLKGLDCMNDDPSSVHVLHATVAAGKTKALIERIAATLLEKLMEADVVPEDEIEKQRLRPGPGEPPRVKLHTTVLNSRFRVRAVRMAAQKARGRNKGGAEPPREPFNATGVMADCASLELGTQPLTVVHLSRRGKFDRSGYYHADHVLRLR